MFPQFKGSDGQQYKVERDEGGVRVHFPTGTKDDTAIRSMLCVNADTAYKVLFDDCKARKVKLTPEKRPTHEIAREISRNWSTTKGGMYFGAVPYLQAMHSMTGTENYGADDGKSILLYFLGNANAYRGGLATAHKLELKALAK